jgi:hypothetical protein
MFAAESRSMGHSVVTMLVTDIFALPSVAPVSSGSGTDGKLFGEIFGKAWTLLAGE